MSSKSLNRFDKTSNDASMSLENDIGSEKKKKKHNYVSKKLKKKISHKYTLLGLGHLCHHEKDRNQADQKHGSYPPPKREDVYKE